MIEKIKYFYLSLDVIISKTFFYSHARFTYVIRDILFSKIFRLTKHFTPLKGSNKKQIPVINEKEFSTRGNSDIAKFSMGYELNYIPEIIKSIISDNNKQIENYLGSGFCYENPLIFRNYKFPKDFSTFDVYSNIWHQDSYNGNRLLKIFVLMGAVSNDDGPFHYLDPNSVRIHWKKLRDRWSFKSFNEIAIIPEQQILTGIEGDYLIIDTSTCSHRASIPSDFRDMLQITLMPKWKKNASNQHF